LRLAACSTPRAPEADVNPSARVISPYFLHLSAVRETACRGRVQTFDRRFAVLRDVLVDFDRCCGKAGGEALERARGQTEEEELYHFHSGFLRLAGAPADLVPPLRHAWLQAILSTVERARNGRDQAKQKRELTLMAVRYGYANMFHTVTDLYNAFLVLRFLRQSPQRTRVILADGHPASPLDPRHVVFAESSTEYFQVASNFTGPPLERIPFSGEIVTFF
jgi:glycoprotein 2-beta-D-xylosyltransferase